jgi:hypothetical protein
VVDRILNELVNLGPKFVDRRRVDTMSITLTRQELYDRVWAEPVDTLAKELRLSKVGLGKACRRHAARKPIVLNLSVPIVGSSSI